MGVRVVRMADVLDGDRGSLEWFASQELTPHSWTSAPGHRYGEHRHGAVKVLSCCSGSIVFHVGGDDIELKPGDQIELEAGTVHGATVGPDGVHCLEAYRDPT